MPKVQIMGADKVVVAKASFDLNRLEITIGRDEENDLIIPDNASISSQHCAIRRVFGGFVLRDLNSSNGIYMNGEREDKFIIDGTQKVTVGDATLIFTYLDNEMNELAHEDFNASNYVKENDVDRLAAVREMGNSPLKDKKAKNKKSKSPVPIIKVVEKSSPPPPKMTYSRERSGSGAVTFIGVLICCAIGLLAGFFFKHSSEHDGGNFIQDLKGNVIQPTWNK